MDPQEALGGIGMNPQEVKVYLYLLRHGAMTQQKISDETGILRQTVYETMNKMESKGYVSVTLQGKRKYYSAIKPELFVRKLEEKKEEFEASLPILSQLSFDSEANIISESFIGFPGLKNLFNLVLESKSDILWAHTVQANEEIFKDYYWDNYAKKRAAKKIPIKLLVEKEKGGGYPTKKSELRETRKNPAIEAFKQSAFVVFDDKVILYSIKNEKIFGTLIQNETIKEMFSAIFMKYWKEGKEF